MRSSAGSWQSEIEPPDAHLSELSRSSIRAHSQRRSTLLPKACLTKDRFREPALHSQMTVIRAQRRQGGSVKPASPILQMLTSRASHRAVATLYSASLHRATCGVSPLRATIADAGPTVSRLCGTRGRVSAHWQTSAKLPEVAVPFVFRVARSIRPEGAATAGPQARAHAAATADRIRGCLVVGSAGAGQRLRCKGCGHRASAMALASGV